MRAVWKCRTVWLIALLSVAMVTSDIAAAESVLNRGTDREPRSIDPHLGFGAAYAEITRDLFEGLLVLSKDDESAPGQARAYSVSDDGLVYTFVLQDDIYWSDGKPVVAEDFVYSFRRLVDPKTASPLAGDAFVLKNARAITRSELPVEALGVAAKDQNTVEITLEYPAPYFPFLLSAVMYRPVPRHAIEAHGKDWTKAGNIVTNGAYVLADRVPTQAMSLVHNEQYYASSETSIERVVYHFTENDAAAFTRYRAGEFDVLQNFSLSQLDWVKENLSDHLAVSLRLMVNCIYINLTRAHFSDERVRKALSLAIDRELITERLMKDGSLPAYNFVTPAFKGYGPNPASYAQESIDQRIANAKRLLTEAGFGESNPLTFTLTLGNTGRLQPIALAVQGMWRDLGVQAELNAVSPLSSMLAARNRDFDLIQQEQVSGYQDPMAVLEIFRRDSPSNFMSYDNPAYEELIDSSLNIKETAKRFEVLRQAEQIAVADFPLIPIYFLNMRRLVNPRIDGWNESSAGRTTQYLSLKDE